jgi:hypothetical protein
MHADTTTAIIKCVIPALAGLYLTVLAFRVVGKKPGQDPRWDAWHQQWGRVMKLVGPALFLVGVVQFCLIFLG